MQSKPKSLGHLDVRVLFGVIFLRVLVLFLFVSGGCVCVFLLSFVVCFRLFFLFIPFWVICSSRSWCVLSCVFSRALLFWVVSGDFQ